MSLMDEGPRQVVTFPFELHDSPRSFVGIGTPDQHNTHTQERRGRVPLRLHDKKFMAVWDTGSVITMVTPQVIETADLQPVGMHPTTGIDGIVKLRTSYFAVIWMPSKADAPNRQGVTLHPSEVVGLEQNGQLGDVDILIGMDIIGRGDAAITVEDGQAWFSYCWPPRGKAIRFENNMRQNRQTNSRAKHPTKKSRRKRR